MLGAIIGDVVGSIFEWDNIKHKEFEFLSSKCFFTDDTVMTLAIAKSILDCKGDYEKLSNLAIYNMQFVGKKYPRSGYGFHFAKWLLANNPKPYNSWGNGAAMRVSSCGFAGKSMEEVIELSRKVTCVTHNHPEGIKGAEATAVAIFLARQGKTKEEIKKYIQEKYYSMSFTLDEIRKDYDFDVSCQGSVPQALEAFFESVSYEDAIRNAISIGGDSDTIAAITGGIAEAYYGIPQEIQVKVKTYLDKEQLGIIDDFYRLMLKTVD